MKKHWIFLPFVGMLLACQEELGAKWCLIEGGTASFGHPQGTEGEQPRVTVELEDFYLSATEVSNAEFQEFIDATDYVTDAEQTGASTVFAQGEWQWIKGVDWRHPDGPESDLRGRMDHPVVHVSYRDARAYCAWKSVRLPSEVELEHALARSNQPYAELNITTRTRQGKPVAVKSGKADGLGCFHLAGNVWEWCEDVYNYEIHDKRSMHSDMGPVYRGKSFDPLKSTTDTLRVIKGGSFLCQAGYCAGYLPHARQSCEQSASYFHIGFRVAKDKK